MVDSSPPSPGLARITWLAVALGLLVLGLLGCSGITVRHNHTGDLLDSWKESVVTGGTLSPRTMQTLRRWDLERVYLRNPQAAVVRLHAEALADPQPDLLFALAEINYLRGRQAEKWASKEAIAAYYLCAGYAYHFLFAVADTQKEPATLPDAPGTHPWACPRTLLAPRDVYDPRFRLACDLYNLGLAKCINAAQRVGRLDPRQELRLPSDDGQAFTLSVAHVGFDWKPEEFGPLILCDDLEVRGLTNQHRSYGLGVPMIATRAKNLPPDGPLLYPKGVSFPVTAFFRFQGGLAELGERRVGRLELYNPLVMQSIEVKGRTVPLETDLTTPLAYFLSHTDLDGFEYTGFLRPDKVQDRTGIYLLEPYQPGKIPVLMVHGLLSSPLTWAPLFNDLRADPVLRANYQFWFYFYPTGNPYMVTAADLRRTVERMRHDLDPKRTDAALDQMVLVGHSMGGLVSRLMTVDSGPDFWNLVSAKPFEEVKMQPETRQTLQPVFFFQRQPSIQRVIFLGTPHRGSRLSPGLPGLLADKLVRLPGAFAKVAQDIAAENPELVPALKNAHIPTSVDLLSPKSLALQLLAAKPVPQQVRYHSVIGVVPPGTHRLARLVAGEYCVQGDTVVPYESAHLDGVESELIVPADHYTVHHHPLAIMEVRRILLEHYRSVKAQNPIQQVAAPGR